MDSEPKHTLTVCSFNLKGVANPEDVEWFAKDIVSKDVDVAAIQGVTKGACDVLFRVFKSSGYTYARFDQLSSVQTKSEHEFLFSKIPVIKKEFQIFVGTRQNKGVSKYLVRAAHRTENPFEVWVATSQLETGGSGNGMRKTQITELVAMLGVGAGANASAVSTPSIFAGDTQIPSWQNADLHNPEGWYDAWKEKGAFDNEKTSEHDRMDQIWWPCSSYLRCANFELCCEKRGVVASFIAERHKN